MKKTVLISTLILSSLSAVANPGIYMECVYTNSNGNQVTQGAWVEDTYHETQQFERDCANNLGGVANAADFEPVIILEL